MSDELHLLTGVQQRATSLYHTQSNGLVERQKRTITNSLVNVLEENPLKWPSIIEGVLIVHRVCKHSSTKYFPIKLLYNREPVLLDVKYKLPSTENSDPGDTVFSSSNVIREEVHRHKEGAKETAT